MPGPGPWPGAGVKAMELPLEPPLEPPEFLLKGLLGLTNPPIPPGRCPKIRWAEVGGTSQSANSSAKASPPRIASRREGRNIAFPRKDKQKTFAHDPSGRRYLGTNSSPQRPAPRCTMISGEKGK